MIGCLCFLIEVSIFYYLYSELGIVLANLLSLLVASVVSFALNSFVNFKRTDRLARRLAKFSIATAIGMTISTVILTLLQPKLGAIGAKFVAIPFAVFVQFTLKKIWVYRIYPTITKENV